MDEKCIVKCFTNAIIWNILVLQLRKRWSIVKRGAAL